MLRVVLPALLLATPALAQHEGHGTTQAAKPKAERKICKRDGLSSTRMESRRICLTAAEWKARDLDRDGQEYRRNDTRQRED